MKAALAALVLVLGAILAPASAPLFARADAGSDAKATRLIDQYGHAVDARELGGRWLLVYFGYAQCKEICPGALLTMSAVLNRLGSSGDGIDPLFVTLDPEHDSPAVLRAFAARFHPRLRALTGTGAAVADAARTFEVPWQRSLGSVIDHGTLFYLVAPDGGVAQALHPQQSVNDLAAQIAKRVSAQPPPAAPPAQSAASALHAT